MQMLGHVLFCMKSCVRDSLGTILLGHNAEQNTFDCAAAAGSMADPLRAPSVDWDTAEKVWDARHAPASGQPGREGDVNNILDLGAADACGNQPLPVTGEQCIELTFPASMYPTLQGRAVWSTGAVASWQQYLQSTEQVVIMLVRHNHLNYVTLSFVCPSPAFLQVMCAVTDRNSHCSVLAGRPASEAPHKPVPGAGKKLPEGTLICQASHRTVASWRIC